MHGRSSAPMHSTSWGKKMGMMICPSGVHVPIIQIEKCTLKVHDLSKYFIAFITFAPYCMYFVIINGIFRSEVYICHHL